MRADNHGVGLHSDSLDLWDFSGSALRRVLGNRRLTDP